MSTRNQHGEIIAKSEAFNVARDLVRPLNNTQVLATVSMDGDPRDGSIIDIHLNGAIITLNSNGMFSVTTFATQAQIDRFTDNFMNGAAARYFERTKRPLLDEDLGMAHDAARMYAGAHADAADADRIAYQKGTAYIDSFRTTPAA